MITIKDKNSCLNLNHMAIYLMLTAEERRLYEEKLKDLNMCTSVTHGIFRFEIVERGDTPYENLPADMTRGVARNCNVLVRLVNSTHGKYCYGLDAIDLAQDKDTIRENLRLFVEDVCVENIDQLDILSHRDTKTAIMAKRMYDDCRIVAEVFEKALEGRTIRKEERPTQEMQRVSPASDLRMSYNIALEAYQNEHSEEIERKICESNAPGQKPTISMYIKHVPNGYGKNGREKKALGLQLIINGDVVNIPLTNTDWLVLYFAIIVAKLKGKTLSRGDFATGGEKKRWLKGVFTALALNKNFDKWYDMIGKSGSTGRINNAKSKLNGYLWAALSSQYKEAYHYLFVDSKDPRSKDSRYEIRLNKAHIHLDDHIQANLPE